MTRADNFHLGFAFKYLAFTASSVSVHGLRSSSIQGKATILATRPYKHCHLPFSATFQTTKGLLR